MHLFNRFKGFSHADFFQPEVHDEVNYSCKYKGDDNSQQEAERLNVHIEAHQIDCDLFHYEPVQDFSHRQANQGCDSCKDDVLPEYLSRSFIWIKAKNLDCGDFSDPLCYVDVGQVVEHNEGQSSGASHNEHYYVVHALHHI